MLLCTKEGCPVAMEVYPSNTKDETTVIDKISEIKNKYTVKDIIFVGDRGMVTKKNIEKIKENEELKEDMKYITALTHADIKDLINSEIIQLNFFDKMNVAEIIDPNNDNIRYCLCLNPDIKKKNKETRDRLTELTLEKLAEIKNYKQRTTPEILGARIGKLLAKYKMGKFIEWEVAADLSDSNDNNKSKKTKNNKESNKLSNNHQVIYKLRIEKIRKEEALDGCFVITSNNITKEEMSEREVVASYKNLTLVEQAFRNLKTVQLEVRPIYHKRDDRIKAHIFLCMLSYYVQWHMQQRLKPLFNNDGKGENRKWTFAGVINTLRQITRNKTSSNGIEFYQNSLPTKTQNKILNYLGIKI